MDTVEKFRPEPSVDEHGLLINPGDWDEHIAVAIAYRVGIRQLRDEHWKVINALRAHYDRFGVAPAMHNICHKNGENDSWVHNLFSTCLDAWRVAGLPDPGEEARAYLSDM
jgi:TusE/DsrC/DsvC family sulfur relay protein